VVRPVRPEEDYPLGHIKALPFTLEWTNRSRSEQGSSCVPEASEACPPWDSRRGRSSVEAEISSWLKSSRPPA
jgi:hypothetical protein